MKQLAILSGKGGTGKTTVTAALADLASKKYRLALVDADVDAANLDLVLSPARLETHAFICGEVAVIDQGICTGCGNCLEVCRFDAIVPGDTWQVDPLACEGCHSCYYQCPNQAIEMKSVQAGQWFRSHTPLGGLFHAELNAGAGVSGKLVASLRGAGERWAQKEAVDLMIIDGPPGVGCPVKAACTDVDLALIVTEPTLSGQADLARILDVADHFDVPALVCINKADLNPERVAEIENYCVVRDVEVLPELIYDQVVPQAMANGLPVTEYTYSKIYHELVRLWDQVDQRLEPFF